MTNAFDTQRIFLEEPLDDLSAIESDDIYVSRIAGNSWIMRTNSTDVKTRYISRAKYAVFCAPCHRASSRESFIVPNCADYLVGVDAPSFDLQCANIFAGHWDGGQINVPICKLEKPLECKIAGDALTIHMRFMCTSDRGRASRYIDGDGRIYHCVNGLIRAT